MAGVRDELLLKFNTNSSIVDPLPNKFPITPSNLTDDRIAKFLHLFLLDDEQKAPHERRKAFHTRPYTYLFQGKKFWFTEELVRISKYRKEAPKEQLSKFKQLFSQLSKLLKFNSPPPDSPTPAKAKEYSYTVFDKNNLKGKGAYGAVYSVTCKLKHDNDRMKSIKHKKLKVVKRINVRTKGTEDNKNVKATLKQENEITRKVTKTQKITFEKSEDGLIDAGYMVQEEFAGKELHKILKKNLTVAQALQLSINLCQAFDFLEKNNIIHRDVKPENILVEYPSMNLKIVDFGESRYLDKPDGRMCGTSFWMSPEIVGDPTHAETKSDVYSLGLLLKCIWKDLWILKLLAPKLSDMQYVCLKANIFDQQRNDPLVFSPNMQSILLQTGIKAANLAQIFDAMTEFDPKKRPSFLAIHNQLLKVQQLLDDKATQTVLPKFDQEKESAESHFQNIDTKQLTERKDKEESALQAMTTPISNYHFAQRHPMLTGAAIGVGVALLVILLASAITAVVFSGGFAAIPLVPFAIAISTVVLGGAITGASWSSAIKETADKSVFAKKSILGSTSKIMPRITSLPLEEKTQITVSESSRKSSSLNFGLLRSSSPVQIQPEIKTASMLRNSM